MPDVNLTIFSRYEKRKAAKQHICTVCKKPIEKGEIYHYDVVMDTENGFYVRKEHADFEKCWDNLGYTFHRRKENAAT